MGGGSGKSFGMRISCPQMLEMSAFTGRFARDERGVSAVIFSILFAALFLFIAISVDYSRALTEQSEQQYALDAAVLAASQHLGAADQNTSGQATADKFFKENMPAGSTAHVTVALNGDNGSICGNSQGSVATTFLGVKAAGEIRQDTMEVGANTCAIKGNGTIEVALVVDNSGSMAGTKIADLKTAAHELVDIVFAGTDGGDKVKVGVIPFAGSVNVGSDNADADWIDAGAQSSAHSENFVTPVSRFSLFADLGQTWGGCVEARPSTVATPYDTNDTAPADGLPDTKFVPMFAPDEPDDANAAAAGYSAYANNYISDYGGTCPAPAQICVRTSRRTGLCTQYANVTIPVAEAQSRVCKYSGAAIVDGTGPNYGCSTPPILPLTSTEPSVEAAIDGLVASGNTNIGEGTMWGWRVLSPTAPFTDGRDYSDTENRKILVIMTDGDNTYSSASNHNQSRYGAFGFGSKNRLGTSYTSTDYAANMDAKLTSACNGARAAGISVYTVAFGTGVGTETLALLRSCAGDEDRAFVAISGSSLIQAFQNIGKDIALLRVSQ